MKTALHPVAVTEAAASDVQPTEGEPQTGCVAGIPGGVERTAPHAESPATTPLFEEDAEVIPVGQEPPRWRTDTSDKASPKPVSQSRHGRRSQSGHSHKDRNINAGEVIRDPDAFYTYKNRLDEIRIFREETMRKLTRAELCVWEAIHNCQFDGAAQISQQRIAELASIKSRRHVSEAIKRLCNMGLLEVLSQGRYRPNGSDGHGLSSVYRVYPRPEPRLLKRIDREQP